MPDVVPAAPDRFEQVYPLLREFGGTPMRREDWRRMLFDLPWHVEEPHRGYMLVEAGETVGFLGTIFSAREVAGRMRRFCNLSSWIVRESHRSSSMSLVWPVLRLRSHTIVNLTASPSAHEIFRHLGFRTLEDGQVLIVPLPLPSAIARWPHCGIVSDPRAIRARLDPGGARIADDMRDTLAGQVLLTDAGRTCFVVATRSPWKGRMMLAHVQYASDWAFLLDHAALAAWACFRTLGTVGLRIDARRVAGSPPPVSSRRSLILPTLYRPAEPDLAPGLVDGLYSELVNQRW